MRNSPDNKQLYNTNAMRYFLDFMQCVVYYLYNASNKTKLNKGETMILKFSTTAEDVESFRRDHSAAWEQYVRFRDKFINCLGCKQYDKFRKMTNGKQYRNQNNAIRWEDLPIDKVTTSKDKLRHFDLMVSYYNDYQVFALRSEMGLVA